MRRWIDLFEQDEATAFSELDRYTEWSGKKINKNAVDWLRTNFPATEDLTLYRGLTIEKEDIERVTKNMASLSTLDAVCIKWYGAPSADLIPGAPCVLKRGNMSSWSYYLEIAKQFSENPRGYRGGLYAKIVVQATIPANKIICDLTTLPERFRQRFPHQKEVIVAAGAIPAIIVSSEFREWYPRAEPGYQWGPLKSNS